MANLYASPLKNVAKEDCFFYHRMELPGVGEVGEQWDLRRSAEQYLGKLDFAGQRVLDVGCASGFLTFEMERRGAEVVSFDMDEGTQWDLVPQASRQGQFEEDLQARKRGHQALKNAYWFAHEKLQSKARVHYGNVYDLPAELGQFDIVLMGMILGHLRDPFQALHSASRLCRGSVVVTNQFLADRQAHAAFMPSRANISTDFWWSLSDKCIQQMLEVLGFDTIRCVRSNPQCLVEGRYRKEPCISIVTRRVLGAAVGVDEGARKAG